MTGTSRRFQPVPPRRTEEEEGKSSLPTFIPLMIAGSHASVRCPRCEGEFQIAGKRWREPLYSVIKPDVQIYGRSCPYCMKVSLIPLEFYPAKDRARLAAKRG